MIHAIDTETSGLKHAHGDKAFAIGYTDAQEEQHVVYVGLDSLIDIDCMMLCSENDWVGHNLGFDLPFLADYTLLPKGAIHDTYIASHIYNNLEPAKDLASLASKYCGIDNREDVALDVWFENNGYNKDNRQYKDVPFEIMTPYLKADLRRTLALFKFYKSKGVIEDPAYLLEMQLVPVVARISARGMPVDLAYAKLEFDKATTLLATLEDRALREHQVENIGSTQQIAEALFTRGGLKCTTFTERGNICLDETSIRKYEHPLVALVLSYRELSKLTKTYLTAIIEKSHKGRLHSSLNQIGARTGRFSSSDPNLQNIPRSDEHSPINLRRAFTCAPGSKLLLVDLSQIELRILAHYSKEPDMIETLKYRSGDLHTATAAAMFGDVTKQLRTVAKTLNFAVIYGAGSEALVEQLNKALPDKKITLAQSKEFKSMYFKGFPKVQEFLWKVQNMIAASGYVFGKSGRKYHCDPKYAYRASNYLIQGESAMLMKKMMLDVENLLEHTGSSLINVIHDELIISLSEDDLDFIPKIVSTIEQLEGWKVPIYANASLSSTNWAEKVPI